MILFARKACAKFLGHAHLIEVQRSLVALEGAIKGLARSFIKGGCLVRKGSS